MRFARLPFVPLALALACGLAVSLPAGAQNFGVQGSLLARKLQHYDPPTSITVEPMDDNSETVAAAAAVRKAFEQKGLKANGSGFVLEIEVDPAATTGIGSRGERLAADRRGPTTNDGTDGLRQLAPTEELSPQTRARSQDRRVSVPHLAVTLNLYDSQAVPVWTALAVARRSNRPLEEQSADLALAALDWFGKSNVNDGQASNSRGLVDEGVVNQGLDGR